MPVGFKNGTDGNVQVAVDAVRAAAARHAFPGIDADGRSAILHTRGNSDCHIILRGGKSGPNFDAESVARATELLRESSLPERVVIDLSHDNSGKRPERQPEVARAVAEQVAAGDRYDQRRDDRVVPDRGQPAGRPARDAHLRAVDHRWRASAGRRPCRCSTSSPRRHAPAARRTAEPLRVAVVGLGLIGGSIALAARERLSAEVSGWDADPTRDRDSRQARRDRLRRWLACQRRR